MRETPLLTRQLISSLTLATAVATTGNIHAEVVVHGSGTRLEGNIAITPDLGETRGGNLFHSFSVFNVLAGENATFSGPDSINNVIARVTGGTSDITGLKASIIDGPVSLSIPNANFYFINPNGIIFGEYGSVNASGSVYLGTADVVRFADGAHFYADAAKSSGLTTADPVAFGFLSDSPAPIELNGPFIDAPVPPGKIFALVAGDINIRALTYGTAIIAPGATVSLTSVGSAGDAAVGGSPTDLSDFVSLGHIQMSGGSLIDVGDSATGTGGGSIYIRGGQLTLTPAALWAHSFGDNDGGTIDIALRGDFNVETDLDTGFISEVLAGSYGGMGAGPAINLDVGGTIRVNNGSFVISESYGPGRAGDISIRAGSVEVQGLGLGEFTGIKAENRADAAGASLTITTGNLQILNGSFVGTKNFGVGSGGNLTINADRVVATGVGAGFSLNLSTETEGGGRAGDLSLNTHTLDLRDGARISSSTAGSGDAGDVDIAATQQLSINGELSGIFSQTNAAEAGNAGSLNITTPLLLVDSGVIEASTLGNGNAGTITVEAGNLQLSRGARIQSFSGGYDQNNNGALVVGTGAAGNVIVHASGGVSITGSTTNGYPGGLFAETRGAGAGGNVVVLAHSLDLGDGATVSSSSLGSGLAGDVNIQLGDSLTLRGGSITTQATESDGGNITITAPRLIHLVNSQVTTSVESGVGSGGNIFIDPQFMVLQNSQIVANAYGGPGGNINIIAGQFLTDPYSVISASSALGIDGTVNIEAPDSDVSADLAALPAAFLDASRLMQAGCGAARAGLSSLVEVGRGGLPAAPDDFLSSSSMDTTISAGSGSPLRQPSGQANLSEPMRVALAMSPKCGN